MAAIIRNINRLTKASLKTSSRSIQSSVDTKLDNSSAEDQPVELENPYQKERQQCILCRLNIDPDYKNVRLLSQFQSVYTGRIYGKHITGLCADKQKSLEREILKAQNAGLMGYYLKNPKYSKDPTIFDPNNPFRPHKF